LFEAADRAPRIVLGTSEVASDGKTSILGGDRYLRAIGARGASVNVPNDPGGVIRRLAYDDSRLLTLPVVAAELARGHPVVTRADFDGDGDAWIDYPGP